MRPPGTIDSGLIIVIILIIAFTSISALLFLILRKKKKKEEKQKDDKYLDIAKERYAKGEINNEDFNRIKNGLS